MLFGFLVIAEHTLDFYFFKGIPKPLFLLIFLILTAALYYLLFSVWHLNKDVSEEDKVEYALTKTQKVLAYTVFISSPLFFIIVLFLFRTPD